MSQRFRNLPPGTSTIRSPASRRDTHHDDAHFQQQRHPPSVDSFAPARAAAAPGPNGSPPPGFRPPTSGDDPGPTGSLPAGRPPPASGDDSGPTRNRPAPAASRARYLRIGHRPGPGVITPPSCTEHRGNDGGFTWDAGHLRVGQPQAGRHQRDASARRGRQVMRQDHAREPRARGHEGPAGQ